VAARSDEAALIRALSSLVPEYQPIHPVALHRDGARHAPRRPARRRSRPRLVAVAPDHKARNGNGNGNGDGHRNGNGHSNGNGHPIDGNGNGRGGRATTSTASGANGATTGTGTDGRH
jgi:hypothetical protein